MFGVLDSQIDRLGGVDLDVLVVFKSESGEVFEGFVVVDGGEILGKVVGEVDGGDKEAVVAAVSVCEGGDVG